MYKLASEVPNHPFKVGDRVRVVAGRNYPIGLTGTIFMIQMDFRFGQHKLLLEDTSLPNEAGINRARPYAKNCEVIN